VYLIRPVRHTYDSATQTGTLTLSIGSRNYADAYKWAVANIGTICSTKSVVVEDGQPIPEGAKFEIVKEHTKDSGELEITFHVVQ
jgi:hypothetical protein